MASTWLFELTSVPGSEFGGTGLGTRFPVLHGEIIDVFDRSVTLALNRFDTCSFRIRVDNPLATKIAACEGYVKAYRDGVLTFYGPIISTEENGDASGAYIAVNCISPGWNLARRFIRLPTQFTATAIDRALLAAEIINWVNNAAIGGNASTGTVDVVPRSGSMSAGGTVTGYPIVDRRFAWDLITELSAGAAGFDWRIMPVEPAATATYAIKTAEMIAAPVLGTSKYNAVFEWGPNTRSNAVSYKRAFDRETQANSIHVFNTEVPGALSGTTDFASYDRWNVMDTLVESEITDSNLLYDLAEAHRNVRAEPRMVIDIQPHVQDDTGRVPRYKLDFDLGDTVRARAVYGVNPPIERFDRLVRVWTVTFNIDDNGVERMALSLADQ